MEGWISLYKKFVNWEWYQDTNVKSVFIHLLLLASYEDKKWQGRKKFVVEITPYYYEHGVCLEDHDGTSAHLYTILISKQTYLRPFNTNKDRIKAI